MALIIKFENDRTREAPHLLSPVHHRLQQPEMHCLLPLLKRRGCRFSPRLSCFDDMVRKKDRACPRFPGHTYVPTCMHKPVVMARESAGATHQGSSKRVRTQHKKISFSSPSPWWPQQRSLRSSIRIGVWTAETLTTPPLQLIPEGFFTS